MTMDTYDAKWNRANRCLIINSEEIQLHYGKWRVYSSPEVDFDRLEDAIEFACILDGLTIEQIEAMAEASPHSGWVKSSI